jgi:hypothetical protein
MLHLLRRRRLLLILTTRIPVSWLLASIARASILAPCVLHWELKWDGMGGKEQGGGTGKEGEKMVRLRELNKEKNGNVGGAIAFLRALKRRENENKTGASAGN